MKRAWYLSIGLLMVWASVALAQAPNNPYADGLGKGLATGWPPFYKPLKITPRDQLYYAMGWCRTNHYHYKPEDLVVVDKLPEGEFKGKVDLLAESGLTMVVAPPVANLSGAPPAKKTMLVLVHPQATQVVITGTAARTAFRPGLHLRFTAQTDEKGTIKEPVDRIEIVGADEAQRVKTVEANKLALIVGRIGQIHHDRITLLLSEGRIRTVTFHLASDASIELFTNELAFANSGDSLEVKGRVYRPDDAPEDASVYATMLTIVRRDPLTAPVNARRKLAAAQK